MKFLQNRKVALLITVIGVLLITVWNVNHSLEKRVDDVELSWWGRYGAETQLKDRCSYASQLWSLCRKHSELQSESGELRRVYNALYDDMKVLDYKAMEEHNTALTAAANAATSKLLALPGLSEEDRDFALRYVNYMDNAARLLRESEYNRRCAEYVRLCEEPWLRVLRGVIFVDAPVQIGADTPTGIGD